jgi:hypothetical protein
MVLKIDFKFKIKKFRFCETVDNFFALLFKKNRL